MVHEKGFVIGFLAIGVGALILIGIGVYLLTTKMNTSRVSLPFISQNSKSLISDRPFPNCFQDTKSFPSATSLSSRCPVYLLKPLKDATASTLAENSDHFTIFQGKYVYKTYKQKPKYDFNVSKETSTTNYIQKNFILNETVDVIIDGKHTQANVVSYRTCSQEVDSTCKELTKFLLIPLPNNLWLEILANQYSDIFSYSTTPELVRMHNFNGPEERVPIN